MFAHMGERVQGYLALVGVGTMAMPDTGMAMKNPYNPVALRVVNLRVILRGPRKERGFFFKLVLPPVGDGSSACYSMAVSGCL